ncbi:hypothetical protein BGX26_001094 [Mortierella sp. AD094]|nr:hypothetical protein BGX26_001094 [Mortierella sp. AD094]
MSDHENNIRPEQEMEMTTSDSEGNRTLVSLASKDSSRLQEGNRQTSNQQANLLFQNVIFYLNPFLGKTKAAELETTLCAYGALKTHSSLTEDDDSVRQNTASKPTHIITSDLDFPDYKHATARGIHIVKLPQYDRQLIRGAVEDYGGQFSPTITPDVTHMVALTASGTIYKFPNPPMLDPDFNVARPDLAQGYAPQLYSNTVKAVASFLMSPSELHTPFLDGYSIIFGDDLNILPERKDKIEEKIREAGGVIVNEYSSDSVDIVICRFRIGNLYVKASRDGKIVASADWLLHVLQTGELPSPKALLLHYPIPHECIPGMSSLAMTISNYTGNVREYLKRMIVAMGATYKPTLSNRNALEPTTHLICGNASGDKYEKGHEWNVKLVNHLWLEDCFQAWSLQSETKPRYTLFPAHNQLSLVFGTNIPPESLDDWIGHDGDEVPQDLDTSLGNRATESAVISSEHIVTKDQINPDEAKVGMEPSPSASTPSKSTSKKLSAGVKASSSDTQTSSGSAPSSPLKALSVTAIGGSKEEDSPSPASTDNPMLGSVRVVSRKRGAALQASKVLQKIVPDMNEFQEELRDEKKASKKKKKHTTFEDYKGDEAMDVDVDESDVSLSTPKKAASSPIKRRRISMNSVEERSTPAGSDDEDGREGDITSNGLRTPPKKTKRNLKVEKDDTSVEVTNTTMSEQSSAAGKSRRVRYISTGLKDQSTAQVKALKALGIIPTTTVEKCTHLVATSIARTGKFLIALLHGKIIVHEDWLQACIDANAILDEDNFRIEDTTNEQKFGMNLYESLDRAREKRVFENCVFYLSPSIRQDMPGLKSVVEAGGGKASTLLHTGLGFLKDRVVKASDQSGKTNSPKSKSASHRKKDKHDPKDGGDPSTSDGEEDGLHTLREKDEIVAVVSSEKDKDMWRPILDAGAHMSDEYQEFQLTQVGEHSPLNPTTNIEVSIDSVTKEKFIYWEDIETFFPGAKHVQRNNNIMVPFMRDMNGQRYNPARIKHYPGTVLRVNTVSSNMPPQSEYGLPPEYSAPQDRREDSSLEIHSQQESAAVVERNIWIPPPDPTIPETEPVIKNFPLLPVPRLFIILPFSDQILNKKIRNENRFQIHFLCDGGEQLQCRAPGNNTSSTIPSHIHLCGHKGYEIDRPADFFDQYGSYVLNLLHMLKYGFPVNGKAVPLTDLEYAWVERESRDGLQYRKKMCPNIEASVDETIEYLYSITTDSRETFEEHIKANNLNDMERVDLTHMRSFLKDLPDGETGIMEAGRPLGKLYCGRTDSGETTWLCYHHYQSEFETTALKHLREAVRWNGGFYDLQCRKLSLVLKPSKATVGGRFLIPLLAKVKRIQELDLTLDWDASSQDLRVLKDCILGMSHLKYLRLDCGDYKGSIIDRVSGGSRADPLVQILMNRKNLKVLDLVRSEEFFTKSSPFACLSGSTTQLQQVHLDALFDLNVHSEKLRVLFQKSPQLKTLSLRCSKLNFCGTVELVKDLIATHKRFQILNLTSHNFKMTLDRAEPGSALLDPVRFEDTHVPCESIVMKRYGAHLQKLLIDDHFTDEHIAILDEITLPQQLHDLKLRQIDICVNWDAFTFNKLTPNGKQILVAILKRLYAHSNTQLQQSTSIQGSPDVLSEKGVIELPPPSSSSSPSQPPSFSPFLSSPSSLQTDAVALAVPFVLSFTVQYQFQDWRPVIREIFPILTSFIIKSPHLNQNSMELSLDTASISESNQFAILKSFAFRGSHYSIKDASAKALIRVIELCPLLESFHMSTLSIRNDQWKEILGALDYSRLKVLILSGNNFGKGGPQFPWDVIPTKENMALQQLNVYPNNMSKAEKQTMRREIGERAPGCKVII